MDQHVQFVSSSQCLVQWCAVSPLDGAASAVCKHQLVSSVSACWHFVFWNLLITIRTQRQCSWCLPAGLPAGAQHRRCHRTPARLQLPQLCWRCAHTKICLYAERTPVFTCCVPVKSLPAPTRWCSARSTGQLDSWLLNARHGTPTVVLWFYTTLNIDMKNQICEEYWIKLKAHQTFILH